MTPADTKTRMPGAGGVPAKRRVFLFLTISIMKKYRVTYTIVDGEHEYADEIVVAAERMDRERAIREVVECALRSDPPDQKDAALKGLLRKGRVFLPPLSRAIGDVTWEETGQETEPIFVTIADGSIENIANIPEDYHIEVRDWDAGHPEVTVWEHDGQWAPGCR